MLTTLLLATMLAQYPDPVAVARAEDKKQLDIELDLIHELQVHALKKMGCFRYVTDHRYITTELTREDCGKPSELDAPAWNRAEKLAKKLFKLAEEK